MKSLYLIEMSISNRITLYEKSISNRKFYTKRLYEKSISKRKFYTKSLYLTEKAICKVYIKPK